MTDLSGYASMVPFNGLLGIEVVAAAPDEVRAQLDWDPSRTTTGGAMHGGAIMGLADTVGGIVAFLNLPDDASGTSTISSSTVFTRGLRDGHALAVGRPLHKGRTTIVVETDVLDPQGKRIARVTQTQAVLR